MTPVEIIESLERRGVTLKPIGENLKVSGISKLNHSEKDILRRHKRALLKALRRCDKTASYDEGKLENFLERSAIMEFDAGLSRQEAEYRAFKLVWPQGSCTMVGAPATVEEALEHARQVFGDACEVAPLELSREYPHE